MKNVLIFAMLAVVAGLLFSCGDDDSETGEEVWERIAAGSSSDSLDSSSDSSAPSSGSLVPSSGSLAPSSGSLTPSSSSPARSSSSPIRSSSSLAVSSGSGICNITSGYCLYSGPHDCWPMPVDDCCEYGTIVANQAACSTTAVKFCNWGTCVGGDGWVCNGGGGCFTINSKDTEADCRNNGAAVVDCCPADTRSPSANYPVCSIVSSSSSVRSSSSSSGICNITSGYCLYSGPHDCWPMPTDDCCEYGTVVANQAACSSTAVKFCNRGTCVGGDGWGCNGGGGCFTINNKDTEANCRSDGATVVDCCPTDTRPPSANYPVCSIVSSSSSVGFSGSYGSVYYEGQTYKTVVIGTQTWFAENLNYNASGSKCYGDCNTYGRLYDWETAKTVCPAGWHLPSQSEWNTLSSYVESTSGCSSCAARLLKKTSGWNSNGNGTDQYGFSALPGGYGYSDGTFFEVGNFGFWWSATEGGNSYAAYTRDMYYNSVDAYWYDYPKSNLESVRCVKD